MRKKVGVFVEEYREKDGYISLDNFLDTPYQSQFSFLYQGKKYFYRQARFVSGCYHELVAEELARDYGIPCAHYDLASSHRELGFISEDIFQKEEKFYRLGDVLVEEFASQKGVDLAKTNNFRDIKVAFMKKYRRISVVDALMNQLIQIFFFDVLIGNIDRHSDNLFLVEKGKSVSFSPLLDNEWMLNNTSIELGGYSLGIDREDYFFVPTEMYEKENFLEKYLRTCSSSDIQFFESKLWIIEEENLENVFQRVEKRIHAPMNPKIREEMLKKFEQNRTMIKTVIKKIGKKRWFYG